MMVRTLRPINGPDGAIPPGTIVDSSAWKHRGYLLQSEHIRGLNAEELDVIVRERMEAEKAAQKGKRG